MVKKITITTYVERGRLITYLLHNNELSPLGKPCVIKQSHHACKFCAIFVKRRAILFQQEILPIYSCIKVHVIPHDEFHARFPLTPFFDLN